MDHLPLGFLAQANTPSPWGMLVPFVLLMAVMYFMLIRPQQRRQREHEDLVKRLKVGDRVRTAGGIFGEVTQVRKSRIQVRIADNCKVDLDPASVTGLVAAEEEADNATKAKASKPS